MRLLKISLALLILAVVLPWPTQPTAAKGLVHRVVISSEALPEDIVVSDKRAITLLAMGRLENFSCEGKPLDMHCGEIKEPADIVEGYVLQRQFKSGVESYHIFDEVVYYPSTTAGHRGYVFYGGIVNGSSEYDKHWYYVSPDAESMLKRLINNPHLKDYLVIAEGNSTFPNIFIFLDPNTLEYVGGVQIPAEYQFYVTDMGVDASGQKLILNLTGKTIETREIDLANFSHCSPGEHRWIGTSFDRLQHLYFINNKVEVRTTDTHELVTEMKLNGNPVKFFPAGDNRLLYFIEYADPTASLWQIDLQDFSLAKIADMDSNNPNYQVVDNQDFGVIYITDGTEAWVWEGYHEHWRSLGELGLESDMQAKIANNHIQPIGMRDGQMMLYHQQNRYLNTAETELAGGIFRVQPYEGEHARTWHTEIPFAHVIYNNNSLYGLANLSETEEPMLYRMDIDYRKILAQVAVGDEAHFMAYVQLDAEFAERYISVNECSTPLF